VAGYFGPVLPTEEDQPYISNVREDGALGSAELAFHSDNEYCVEPLIGITLQALEVEDEKTSTRYADSVGAYRRLPMALKERLKGLEARHVLATDLSTRNRNAQPDPRWPHQVHPVVKIHPTTGEPILYVTMMQTYPILGLPEAESETLLGTLFGYLYAPENVLEHHWRRGDLAIWDNLGLQHARGAVSNTARTLQRVGIGLSLPAQYPTFAKDFAEMQADILRSAATRVA
jgi:taurine dioxygenase